MKTLLMRMVAIASMIGAVQAGTVTLVPSTQYQIMQGWVAVLGIGGGTPNFQQQQMLNRGVNELGLTTLRLDLPFNGDSATEGVSWYWRIDNTNPSVANWASFDTLSGVTYNTVAADQLMTQAVVPFKQLVQTRGDPFTMYTNPSFYTSGSTGPMPTWVQYNTGEYAEYLVSLAEYLSHKYGIAPNYMTIINEAGNNNAMTPSFEARVIKAVGPMLQAAGLSTKIQLAECVNSTNTLTYTQDSSMTSDVLKYVGTVSWHDYGTQSSSSKASIYSYAQAHGLMTAETEMTLGTYQTMYDDIVNGGVSYWGQYFLGGDAAGGGIQYYNTGLDGASMSLPSQYWNWRQVINYVRPGAVRIGATSDDNSILTMAFQKNGQTTVTLFNQSSPAQTEMVTVADLPAGNYGVSYSTPSVGTTELGVQTVGVSNTLTVSVPDNSVLTIYPHGSANLPPEVYQYTANPTYLKLGAGSTTTLTAAATDPELDTLTYAWSVASKPTGANVTLTSPNTASTNANGLTVAGMYIFNVNVSDGHTIVTSQVALNVLVGNQPPIISVVQARAPNGSGLPLLLTQPQNSSWLLDQVAYDLEGDTLSYSWTVVSQPSGASASLATPTASACVANNLNVAGNYVFQITVSDGTTPVSQTVTVTVDPTNLHAPTQSNVSGSVVSGSHGHLAGTASDADGDWISSWWDVITKPAGSTVTFTDPAAATTDFVVDTPGTYTFQLSTVDRTLYVQSSNINVTISSVPPTINSGQIPTTPTVGQTYNFTFLSSGSPTPTLSVTSGTLPPGLTLSTAGVLSGTPSQTGIFNFTITASNGVSPEASQSYNLSIGAVTFAQWAAAYNISADPTATPEGDGVSNVLKYLYNINPTRPMTVADRAALPVFGTTTTGGNPFLTLTYAQYPSEFGITINVQTSPDLLAWATLNSTQYTNQSTGGTDPNGDPYMEIEVPASGSREFIRLNITLPSTGGG
jgi:hypothetical protein